MIINAVLYVAENGCKWRALPPRLGNWHLRRALGQIAEEAHANGGLTDLIRNLAREIHEELAGLDRRSGEQERPDRVVASGR